MSRYIFTRALLVLPTLLAVAVLIFLLMRVVPGDIVELRLVLGGSYVTPGVIAAERARLGLDRPLWDQFLHYLVGLARLDLGLSMWSGAPVAHEIGLRLALSLQLAVMATLIAVALAVPLGTLAAVYRGSWIDQAVQLFSVAGLSIPSFWLGILLILFLLSVFNYLPPLIFTPLLVDPKANLAQLIWPALAVGYRYSAVTTRMTRSALLEVLREDYVRTAWAKGLRRTVIVRRHALRNALLPVVTVIGLEFAFLIGGLVVTEQVFNLNGIGKLTVEAIAQRDYTLIQGLMLVVAAGYILANFVVDVLYAWLDPRITYG
ncbi:MAG: ABC transporter permease [Armatimonadota bacterium]|nr:ABC transporter permease [Armatimonadota bacterium]MDR7427383.1 ABC transporter permease [Armatimonadota bacterium]MDR7464342.1 ABC transporter permease [Armatimonadota bacterium]MDR7470093.1 ABC transporter permease [Armatimonadota bacterium]MDR7474970.1 ABC transporter permease [Armatimonadota bacterium]